LISNRSNGYRDLLAWIDLSTYRRISWENNVPFFLVTFRDPDSKMALAVDPRGVVARAETRTSQELGYHPYAGVEYEVNISPP
jgi:glutamine synthetase